ncbi:imidazole glycerol phosphate synthase subunit HisH [Psychroflexus salis]|uniref:Imidazole glycerol phosphate synthase subunit HisH n=1 Tax=Psychroflexus salis TaxID=1526574 RepID=A0A917E8X6_9FLAO|nr:imidazole glycerol phosphate synthase subunit HisH [Psychroflexus salis]GGE10859.1 imidazole glycerol phosphate synthase subunit HisH [Psychroflexus salis]
MNLIIINYGVGNIKSIQFAFQRLGVEAKLSSNWEEIQQADRVIFPGVGEANYAMQQLQKTGLDKLIPSLQQPVLGICLGMQLMCTYSEEGNTDCLGIFDAEVKKFSNALKVPQIAWNQIFDLKSAICKDIKEKDYMYLVHSYYVPINKHTIATTNYGIDYTSALQKHNFYGVQFHPEKSGKVGEQLLKNFLAL